MNRLFIFIFILPIISLGQTAAESAKAGLEKIYTQAITDFIKDANKKNKTPFDTLFFGNRKNAPPDNFDDFPDITLPAVIEHTHILVISPEEGKIKQNERLSRIYINLLGWVDKGKAEFMFFVFSNGFAHQYNYAINYTYNSKTKAYEMVKLVRKDQAVDK